MLRSKDNKHIIVKRNLCSVQIAIKSSTSVIQLTLSRRKVHAQRQGMSEKGIGGMRMRMPEGERFSQLSGPLYPSSVTVVVAEGVGAPSSRTEPLASLFGHFSAIAYTG